jgi:hypothetical protein
MKARKGTRKRAGKKVKIADLSTRKRVKGGASATAAVATLGSARTAADQTAAVATLGSPRPR